MLLPNEHYNGTETFLHRLPDAHTHTHIQSYCLKKKRKIAKENSTMTSLIFCYYKKYGFRFFTISYCFKFFFFGAFWWMFFFIRWLYWLQVLCCAFSHFWLADHGPLSMNNYLLFKISDVYCSFTFSIILRFTF